MEAKIYLEPNVFDDYRDFIGVFPMSPDTTKYLSVGNIDKIRNDAD